MKACCWIFPRGFCESAAESDTGAYARCPAGRVCVQLDIDRSGLWQVSEQEPNVPRLTHCYRPSDDLPIEEDPDAKVLPDRDWGPRRLKADHFRGNANGCASLFPVAFCKCTLKCGRAIAIANREQLPAEAADDREMLRRSGVTSLVIVPLSFGGAFLGCMTFKR